MAKPARSAPWTRRPWGYVKLAREEISGEEAPSLPPVDLAKANASLAGGAMAPKARATLWEGGCLCGAYCAVCFNNTCEIVLSEKLPGQGSFVFLFSYLRSKEGLCVPHAAFVVAHVGCICLG